MDQSDASLALKSLAEFWADMGLEEARPLAERQSRGGTAGSSPRVNQPSRSTGISPQASSPQPTGPRPPPRRLSNNPVAEARRLATQATSLGELKAAIERFDGCTLKAGARTTAVCDGVFDAPVMIVGEAPGADEDKQGLPFVGRAGKLLDKMLETIGLSRKTNVYITNLVYWRPPGNREPSTVEMEVCAPFLKRQIELKQPKILLTAGKFATSALLDTTDGIMRLRGRKLRYTQEGLAEPVPCIPLLHPAYLLRRPEDKSKAWEDLRTIAVLCDALGIRRDAAL